MTVRTNEASVMVDVWYEQVCMNVEYILYNAGVQVPYFDIQSYFYYVYSYHDVIFALAYVTIGPGSG